jgi:hypothetical protein
MNSKPHDGPGFALLCGSARRRGRFRCLRTRDLDVDFGEHAHLRLIASDRLAELYVNDYLADNYDITGCSGQITVLSVAPPISVRAWQPDPEAAHPPWNAIAIAKSATSKHEFAIEPKGTDQP